MGTNGKERKSRENFKTLGEGKEEREREKY